ncbi:MAG: hypothetical protein AAFV98_13430, partial [Chloroflexota bacterium]
PQPEPENTIDVEFGRMTVIPDRFLVYFFAKLFPFLSKLFAESDNPHPFSSIILVDSAKPDTEDDETNKYSRFEHTKQLISIAEMYGQPYVIVATKACASSTYSLGEIGKRLDVSAKDILACDVIAKPNSSRYVLATLLRQFDVPYLDEAIEQVLDV